MNRRLGQPFSQQKLRRCHYEQGYRTDFRWLTMHWSDLL